MVKGIEEIGLELQRLAFRELEILQERDIPVVNSGPTERIAPHISDGEQWNSARDHAGTVRWNGLTDRRPECTNQIHRIDQKVSGYGPRQAAAMETVRSWTEGLLISDITDHLDRANHIWPIEAQVQEAAVIAGEQRVRITSLKGRNGRNCPAAEHL